MSRADIGRHLGLSREYVRQIEKRALEKLRRNGFEFDVPAERRDQWEGF